MQLLADSFSCSARWRSATIPLPRSSPRRRDLPPPLHTSIVPPSPPLAVGATLLAGTPPPPLSPRPPRHGSTAQVPSHPALLHDSASSHPPLHLQLARLPPHWQLLPPPPSQQPSSLSTLQLFNPPLHLLPPHCQLGLRHRPSPLVPLPLTLVLSHSPSTCTCWRDSRLTGGCLPPSSPRPSILSSSLPLAVGATPASLAAGTLQLSTNCPPATSLSSPLPNQAGTTKVSQGKMFILLI